MRRALWREESCVCPKGRSSTVRRGGLSQPRPPWTLPHPAASVHSSCSWCGLPRKSLETSVRSCALSWYLGHPDLPTAAAVFVKVFHDGEAGVAQLAEACGVAHFPAIQLYASGCAAALCLNSEKCACADSRRDALCPSPLRRKVADLTASLSAESMLRLRSFLRYFSQPEQLQAPPASLEK